MKTPLIALAVLVLGSAALSKSENLSLSEAFNRYMEADKAGSPVIVRLPNDSTKDRREIAAPPTLTSMTTTYGLTSRRVHGINVLTPSTLKPAQWTERENLGKQLEQELGVYPSVQLQATQGEAFASLSLNPDTITPSTRSDVERMIQSYRLSASINYLNEYILTGR